MAWEINEGKEYSCEELSDFIKMRRHFFTDRSIAMRLVSELKSVKINVEKEFERANDNKGSIRQAISQKVIDSNIPDSFIINMPIFKGGKAVAIEIEVYVNPSSFQVSLVSPQLEELIENCKNELIDSEIELIQSIEPSLVILEQ